VLPLFNLCNAACSVGLTEGALGRAIAHASSTRYQHLDSSLADLPTIRAYLARARIQADSARTLWQDAIAALESGRADTMLRVLQVKAAANETAISVTQECMRTSGGAGVPPRRRTRAVLPRRSRRVRHGADLGPALRLHREGHLRPASVLMRVSFAKDAFVLGAVAYDPKVVTIWEGFRTWFRGQGLAFDYVLFSNYERRCRRSSTARSTSPGTRRSPGSRRSAQRLAGASARRRSRCATPDRDLTSVVVVRADSPIRTLADLRGRTVAVGASDSPQATLIPLVHLRREGWLVPGKDFEVRTNEVMVGMHGDHVGGERDAARQLVAGEADAACMIDGNHLAFSREGTFPKGTTRVLSQTGAYDHCNFSVLEGCARGGVPPLHRAPPRAAVRRRRGAPASRPRRSEGVERRTHHWLRAPHRCRERVRHDRRFRRRLFSSPSAGGGGAAKRRRGRVKVDLDDLGSSAADRPS
jgi:hypothetical protein